jgi:hypothetical protein
MLCPANSPKFSIFYPRNVSKISSDPMFHVNNLFIPCFSLILQVLDMSPMPLDPAEISFLIARLQSDIPKK